ncbi:MAG: flavodoxin domain-containing protein [Burkholderiales bacterium]|nr:flavodoxin domain-containing protein [Burkholderiales bacterium]
MQEASFLLSAVEGATPLLMLYATQTGQSEEIARQSARFLHTAGVPVRLAELSEIDRDDLLTANRALFVVSTYGEGDPPDGAATFAHDVMETADAPDLRDLHFGVLALGDRNYDHFCGFGRSLDEWLLHCGARPLFERIDADKTDASALTQWHRRIGHVAGTLDLPDWEAPVFEPWQLAARRHLNPGSSGEPVFHLELIPPPGAAPHWEAGDLAQIQVPTDPDHPREYSISSLPSDGRVHLLVRRTVRPDGSLGIASGWLTQARPGTAIPLRLRAHAAFQQNGNATRALILIGNGTGMAGLRAHLKARAQFSRHAGIWLLFGERQAAHDAYYQEELEAWLASGTLSRLDQAFSRDQEHKRYVQHLLRENPDILRTWTNNGAAIYVCGSLKGMARDVDSALHDILGQDVVRGLVEQGRYRRDVY